MAQPRSLGTWTIGEGRQAVTMGVYEYTARDDADSSKILKRGFVVCPVKKVATQMGGFYEPDTNARMGFSQNRGSEIAVASGAETPDDLTELQNEKARQFLADMKNLLQERIQAVPLEYYNVHPEKILEATPWDNQVSTSLYIQYEPDGRGFKEGIKTAILDAFAKTGQKQEPGADQPQTVIQDEADWNKIIQEGAKPFIGSRRSSPQSEPFTPKQTALVLGELGRNLLLAFPGPANEAKRNQVFEKMRAIFDEKTLDSPSP